LVKRIYAPELWQEGRFFVTQILQDAKSNRRNAGYTRAVVRFDEDDSGETEWIDISFYTKVRFRIAFTMYGAEAFDVEIV